MPGRALLLLNPTTCTVQARAGRPDRACRLPSLGMLHARPLRALVSFRPRQHIRQVVSASTDWSTEMAKLEERSAAKTGPRLELDAEGCVREQLDALRDAPEVGGLIVHPWRNQPVRHPGIEVAWNFANIDVLSEVPRHVYFGMRGTDLSRFTYFARTFCSRDFAVLVGFTSYEILGRLDISEVSSVFRVQVNRKEEARGAHEGAEVTEVFAITVSQRVGGFKDGIWYTDCISRED